MPETDITHPDQLLGLSVSPLTQRRRAGSIRIMDESVGPKQRRTWEAQLNQAYFACGCAESATGILLAGLLYLVALATIQPDLGSFWGYLGWGTAAIVAGAAIGKVLGLWAADRRLDAIREEIRRNWKAEPRPGEDFYACG